MTCTLRNVQKTFTFEEQRQELNLLAADVYSICQNAVQVPLNVTTAPLGTASLTYNNNTGEFVYTPPDLSGYSLTNHTHDYNTLTNLPTLFDGDYNSLTNKPDLSIYLTSETSHADVLVDGDFTSSGLMFTDGSGNYSIDNNTYLTSVGSINEHTDVSTIGVDAPSPYDTLIWSGSVWKPGLVGNVPLTDFSVNTAVASGGGSLSYDSNTGVFDFAPAVVFSGDYDDLTNKPNIPTVPTNNNQLTNGAGYITGIGSFSIGALDDVDTTTVAPSPDKVLKWNGSDWVPGDASVVANLSDLGDVNVTNNAGTDGLVLKYQHSSQKWIAASDQTATGGSGISLTDLSVTVSQTPVGNGNLTYDDGLGVFTYIPPDFSSAGGIALTDISLTQNSASGGGALTYDDTTGEFEYTPPSIPAAQIKSDWNSTTGLSEILNKPTLFSGSYTDLTNKPTLFDGDYTSLSNTPTLFSGDYDDLTNKPAIPAAQVNSDWNATTGLGEILNKPTLFSGSYNDLTDTPAIPAAQIQADWNQSGTSALDYIKNKPTVPTKIEDLDVTLNQLSIGHILKWNGTNWENAVDLTGGGGSGYGIAQILFENGPSGQISAVSGGGSSAAWIDVIDKDITLTDTNQVKIEVNGEPRLNGFRTMRYEIRLIRTTGGTATTLYEGHQGLSDSSDNYSTMNGVLWLESPGSGTHNYKYQFRQVISWNSSTAYVAADSMTMTLTEIAVGGGGGSGIALSDLSVGTESIASGDGGISYNDNTGVFTYTPPVIPSSVQSDWDQNSSSADDYIKNKPAIPAAQIQVDWNQSGTSALDYIKNKPTIPAAQVQSDWNATTGLGEILNKPTIVTNNNQLTNGAGYLTSFTEADTLNTVTGRGSTTTNAITVGGNGTTGGVSLLDGNIAVRTGTGNVASIDLYCEVSNAHKISIKAPLHANYSGDVNFVLPPDEGTNGWFLKTDGSGTTSWAQQATSSTPNLDAVLTAGNTSTTAVTVGNFTCSNLTVNGTTTTVNSNTVNIGDNILVLNSDETSAPSQNGGIEIERGTSTNVSLRWNETSDKWQYTNDGTNFENIGGGFTSGMIMMYKGTVAPSGWVICDNSTTAQNAGAPDLRDRFVIGAGNTYSLNDTGGSADAVIVSHDHNANSGSDGNHVHSVGANGTTNNTGNHEHGDGNYGTNNTGNHSHNQSGSGSGSTGNQSANHYHTTDTSVNTGSDGVHQHRWGTDDLIGAQGGNNNPDASGGTDWRAWTDSQGAHSHTFNFTHDTMGVSENHTHDFNFNIGGSTGNDGSHSHNVTGNSGNGGSHSHNLNISVNETTTGNHAHNVSIDSEGSSGVGKNLPPYYALMYIMKL